MASRWKVSRIYLLWAGVALVAGLASALGYGAYRDIWATEKRKDGCAMGY